MSDAEKSDILIQEADESSDDDLPAPITESLAPGLIVAAPELGDPNFRRSVILMIEHNAEGAVGIILNQETDASISELCQDQEIESHCDELIRLGGPLAHERIWVLHHPGAIQSEAFRLSGEISISVTREALEELAGTQSSKNKRKGPFLVVAGYAGWGAGQLESEIGQGAWIPYPLETDTVFSMEPENMWSSLMLSLGTFIPRSGGDKSIN